MMIIIFEKLNFEALILILLLGFFSIERGSSLETMILQDEQQGYSLGKYIEIMEEDSDSFTIFSAVQPGQSSYFQSSYDDIPNFGYTKNPYWVRFNAKNGMTQAGQYFLVLKNTTMDYMDVYSIDSRGNIEFQQGGRQILLPQRKIPHRFTIIPFALNAGEMKQFYIRLEGLSMQIPLFLYPIDTFYAEDHREQLLWGIYFGLNLVMVLYNFFIFLYGKDLSYLFISFFIFSFNMFIFFFNGFGQEYISSAGFLSSDGIHVFFGGGLSTLTALLFIKEFLDLDQLLPKIHRWLIGIFILNGIMFLSVFFTPSSFFLPLSSYFSMLVVSFVFVMAILALLKGSQHALFYLMSWLGFLTSLIPFLLKEFGLMQPNFMTNFGMQIGSSILVLMLSLAVAHKIRTIHLEKERALVQSENLVELDKSKSAFFSNVTHEFRTPLSNISVSVESLVQLNSLQNNPEILTLIKIIRRNCNQLLNLVNTFLSFSQFDEGKMKLHKKYYNIERLIQYYCASISTMAELKGVHLSFVQQEINHRIVHLDPNLFEFAFINILSNAVKFTEAGGSIKVSLTNTELTGETEALKITVEDTGIGIPEEKIQKIFHRFYQVEDSVSRKYEGSGLGLPLSKEIVKLHGGTIQVQSTVGLGSTFSLTLPVEGMSQSIDQEKIETPALIKAYRIFEYPSAGIPKYAVSNNPDAKKRGTILVVEDNKDLIHILHEFLSRDYTVRMAQNGLKALENLQTKGIPDLIISDIMMPEMNGKELYETVKSNDEWRLIPFIFLTARASQQEKLEFLAQGAVDYLYKPFSAEELLLKTARQISDKVDQRNEVLKGVEGRVMQALHPEMQKNSQSFNFLPDNLNLSKLTKREKDIVTLIADGRQDKEIAGCLNLSVRTISNNLHKMYTKLDVNNRIELLNKLQNPKI